MAEEMNVVEIPEEQVEVETWGPDDEKKGAGMFALVLAIGAGIGAAVTVAIGKGKKAISDWQTNRHLKRKEREAQIEAELATRQEEEATDNSEDEESSED